MQTGATQALILGGTGFLGAHLARSWCRRSSEPCVVAAREPERLPEFEHRDRVQLVPWDALQPGATERLFNEVRPTLVILAAALARAGDCERDPEAARAMNSDVPASVADLCRGLGARLVHISTDLVFGARAPRGERYSEDDPVSPVNLYGRSKADGERAVLAADPAALVVRLPLLCGPSFGRGLGASDALCAALERDEEPRLFRDEWRTPLEVENAAEAVWELALTRTSGILHVAGPERLSRWELGEIVRSTCGSEGRTTSSTRAEAGVQSSRAEDASLDTRRAVALLRTPLLSPRESLRPD